MTESRSPEFVVKICGITRAEDALAAVEFGANALGFNFYHNSPRYIEPHRAHRIASLLPENVLKVGVFVEPALLELQKIIDAVPLDVVQLHGRCPSSIAHRTWRALVADGADPSESLTAEAILLDSPTPHHGGSGKTYDWNLATRFWQPVIVAGGLDASNVADAIEIARPWGVDSASRLESAPGVKDHKKVKSFIEAAWAASRIAVDERVS